MQIECEVIYNKELSTEFNRIHLWSYRIIVSIICPFIFLIMAFILRGDNFFLIGFILAAIIIDPILWLTINYNIKNSYKKNTNLNNNIIKKYIFTNSLINIETKGDNISSASTFEYKELYKIVESQKLIILYQSKLNAFVIPKDSVVKGNINDLIDIIKSKNIPYRKVKMRG